MFIFFTSHTPPATVYGASYYIEAIGHFERREEDTVSSLNAKHSQAETISSNQLQIYELMIFAQREGVEVGASLVFRLVTLWWLWAG